MDKKTILKLRILLPLAFSLVGCATEPPQALPTDTPVLTNTPDFNQAAISVFNQTYILSNQPCSPPCWQGLTIGSSTGDEVVATLSGLEFVARFVVNEPNRFPDFDPKAGWVEGQSILVYCQNQRRCMDMILVHDRLREIIIRPDDGLMLADAIESFGNPDYLYPLLSTGPKFDCRIEILWVEKQLELYSAWTGHNLEDVRNCHAVIKDGILPKDLIIADVYYLPIEEIHDRLEWREYTEFKGTK
jgi:hypothetical protein